MRLQTYKPWIEIQRFLIVWRQQRRTELRQSLELMRSFTYPLLSPLYLEKDALLQKWLPIVLSHLWLIWRMIYCHGQTFAPYNNQFVISTLRDKKRLLFFRR